MKERDEIRPFIIPKTCASTKEVLIPEKPNSRNVTDLFDDVKAFALETQFDFGQTHCQSCDKIRNQKLQKFYNARRMEMKKEQEPVERLAFHLVSNRDVALAIANDGLQCDQLSLPIEKYLGNPKDGVHLCKRPDVLLISSSKQRLKKFGLLIFKILLGKGYSTAPSSMNNQLAAQLHYDHHYCKTLSTSQDQRPIETLLSESLIFCYEHRDLELISHPTQILPIAILWYDLKDNFTFQSSLFSRTTQQQRTRQMTQRKIAFIQNLTTFSLNSQVDLTKDSPLKPPIQRNSSSARPTEVTILSPQKFLNETSATILPPVKIPLNSTTSLVDPRASTDKSTRSVCYLEPKTLQHAIQQQKRLNRYCQSVQSSTIRTSYTVIPLILRLEDSLAPVKTSLSSHYPPLSISVIDCLDFGFVHSTGQMCIDLEDEDNQLAFEQIEIANQLFEQNKKLQSRERRLSLREERHRQSQAKWKNENKLFTNTDTSKIYFQNGREALKNHSLPSSYRQEFSNDMLNFFSFEYQHENRLHVKRLLAELMGIFQEKYPMKSQSNLQQNNVKSFHFLDENPQSMNQGEITHSVMDMDLESSDSQLLGDLDERFPGSQSPALVPINSVTSTIQSDPKPQNDDTLCQITHPLDSVRPNPPTPRPETDEIVNANIDFPQPSGDSDERRRSLENNQNLIRPPSTHSDSPSSVIALSQPNTPDTTAKRMKLDSTTTNNASGKDVDQRLITIASVKPAQRQSSTSFPGKGRRHKKLGNALYRSFTGSFPQRPSFNGASGVHQRFDSSHQLASNNLPFANSNYQPFNANGLPKLMAAGPTNFVNHQNHFPSYYGNSPGNYPYFTDTPPIQPLMGNVALSNFSSSFTGKSSETFERLQMFLQHRP